MLSDVLFKGSGSFQGRVEPTTRREAGGWGWIRAKNHCDGSQASPFLAKARTKSARWLALVIRVSCGHSFALIVSVVVLTEAGLYIKADVNRSKESRCSISSPTIKLRRKESAKGPLYPRRIHGVGHIKHTLNLKRPRHSWEHVMAGTSKLLI